jgi:hypothetical protein
MPQFKCYFNNCNLAFSSALSLSNHQRSCGTNAMQKLSYQIKKRKIKERKQVKLQRRAQDHDAAQLVAVESGPPCCNLEGDAGLMAVDTFTPPDLPVNLPSPELVCFYCHAQWR